MDQIMDPFNVNLFFHMLNHYKKLQNVKPVIDSSTPKGYDNQCQNRNSIVRYPQFSNRNCEKYRGVSTIPTSCQSSPRRTPWCNQRDQECCPCPSGRPQYCTERDYCRPCSPLQCCPSRRSCSVPSRRPSPLLPSTTYGQGTRTKSVEPTLRKPKEPSIKGNNYNDNNSPRNNNKNQVKTVTRNKRSNRPSNKPNKEIKVIKPPHKKPNKEIKVIKAPPPNPVISQQTQASAPSARGISEDPRATVPISEKRTQATCRRVSAKTQATPCGVSAETRTCDLIVSCPAATQVSGHRLVDSVDACTTPGSPPCGTVICPSEPLPPSPRAQSAPAARPARPFEPEPPVSSNRYPSPTPRTITTTTRAKVPFQTPPPSKAPFISPPTKVPCLCPPPAKVPCLCPPPAKVPCLCPPPAKVPCLCPPPAKVPSLIPPSTTKVPCLCPPPAKVPCACPSPVTVKVPCLCPPSPKKVPCLCPPEPQIVRTKIRCQPRYVRCLATTAPSICTSHRNILVRNRVIKAEGAAPVPPPVCACYYNFATRRLEPNKSYTILGSRAHYAKVDPLKELTCPQEGETKRQTSLDINTANEVTAIVTTGGDLIHLGDLTPSSATSSPASCSPPGTSPCSSPPCGTSAVSVNSGQYCCSCRPALIKISAQCGPSLSCADMSDGQSSFCACAEEHDYLHFLLRITEDILRNDLYSNKDMQRVFDSHMEANKNFLDKDKMQEHLDNLKKELNFPSSCTSEEQTMEKLRCLCPNPDATTPTAVAKCDRSHGTASNHDNLADNREATNRPDLSKPKKVDQVCGRSRSSSPDRCACRPRSDADEVQDIYKFSEMQYRNLINTSATTSSTSTNPDSAACSTFGPPAEVVMTACSPKASVALPFVPQNSLASNLYGQKAPLYVYNVADTLQGAAALVTNKDVDIDNSVGTDVARYPGGQKTAEEIERSTQSEQKAAAASALKKGNREPERFSVRYSTDATAVGKACQPECGHQCTVPALQQDSGVKDILLAQDEKSVTTNIMSERFNKKLSAHFNEDRVDSCVGQKLSSHVKIVTDTPNEKMSQIVFYNTSQGQTCHCSVALRKTGVKIQMDEEKNGSEEYVLIDGPVCLPKSLLDNKTVPIMIENLSGETIKDTESQRQSPSRLNFYLNSEASMPSEDHRPSNYPKSYSRYGADLSPKLKKTNTSDINVFTPQNEDDDGGESFADDTLVTSISKYRGPPAPNDDEFTTSVSLGALSAPGPATEEEVFTRCQIYGAEDEASIDSLEADESPGAIPPQVQQMDDETPDTTASDAGPPALDYDYDMTPQKEVVVASMQFEDKATETKKIVLCRNRCGAAVKKASALVTSVSTSTDLTLRKVSAECQTSGSNSTLYKNIRGIVEKMADSAQEMSEKAHERPPTPPPPPPQEQKDESHQVGRNFLMMDMSTSLSDTDTSTKASAPGRTIIIPSKYRLENERLEQERLALLQESSSIISDEDEEIQEELTTEELEEEVFKDFEQEEDEDNVSVAMDEEKMRFADDDDDSIIFHLNMAEDEQESTAPAHVTDEEIRKRFFAEMNMELMKKEGELNKEQDASSIDIIDEMIGTGGVTGGTGGTLQTKQYTMKPKPKPILNHPFVPILRQESSTPKMKSASDSGLLESQMGSIAHSESGENVKENKRAEATPSTSTSKSTSTSTQATGAVHYPAVGHMVADIENPSQSDPDKKMEKRKSRIRYSIQVNESEVVELPSIDTKSVLVEPDNLTASQEHIIKRFSVAEEQEERRRSTITELKNIAILSEEALRRSQSDSDGPKPTCCGLVQVVTKKK